MGVFSGMKKARPTQGGNYVRPGNYVFEILRCKLQETSMPGQNKKWFIVELRVLNSVKTDNEIDPNKTDDEPSWLVELPGKFPDLALGNIKSFALAAFGSIAAMNGEEAPGEEDLDDDDYEEIYEEDSPIVGAIVVAKAFNKQTKQGNDFTRLVWDVPDDAVLKKYAE